MGSQVEEIFEDVNAVFGFGCRDYVIGKILSNFISHVNRDWSSLYEARAVYNESRLLAEKVLEEM